MINVGVATAEVNIYTRSMKLKQKYAKNTDKTHSTKDNRS